MSAMKEACTLCSNECYLSLVSSRLNKSIHKQTHLVPDESHSLSMMARRPRLQL